MEQWIKFVITGDTKQLDQTLKQSEQQLRRYEQNIANIQRSINQSTQTSQRYQRAIQNLNSQLRNGQISQRQYTQALEQNRTALNAADQNTVDLQRELQRLQSEYTKTKRRVDVANRSFNQGGQQLQKIGRRGGSATSAITSFSQVIQDAPFGIRGVANNLEQLSTQLIFLQQSAGGSRAAMRALLSSLAGPAGILVAISLVTASMNALSTSSVRLSDVLNFLIGDTNDLAKAQRALAEASRETIGNAQSEITTLNALLEVARDNTRSTEERQRAIAKINEDYPKLIENLNLENIGTEKVTEAVDKLSDSLVRQAKIRGAQNLIAEETAKILELQEKSAIDAANAWDLIVAAANPASAALTLITRGAERQSQQISEAEERIQQFTDRLRELIGEDIDEEGVFTDIKKKVDEIVDRSKDLTPIEVPVTVGDLDTLDINAVAKRAKSGGLKLVEAFKLIESGSVSSVQNIESSLDSLERVVTPATISFGKNLLRVQEEAKIMSDVVSAGFNAMTQQIVQSLNTGSAVLDAIVSTFVGAITEIIAASISQSITEKALSKTKIATEQAKSNANAITIATNFAASLGPGGVIALPGILASQLAIINAAFSGIQAFAQGGIVGGGQFTGDNIPIFVNSGERILTTQDQSLLTQFLRGNFGGTTNRMGDAGPIRIEGVLRGDNIRLSNERATRRNRRFGSGING